jgi:transposase-like protein
MVEGGSPRRFSREFKLAALARMAAGENVSALARELGVARKYLYQWRERFLLGGPIALRSRGRMTKAEKLSLRTGVALEPAPQGLAMPAPEPPDELARARERMVELERKIAQQALDLDFFQQALQRIEASRRPSDGPGGTASSPRSRR